MKAALGCLAVGSVAGIYAFTGQWGAAVAEALYLLGYLLGLAFLFNEIRKGASRDPRRPSR